VAKHRGLRGRPKILYALVPPASLKNVGDQAQAVAIRAWMAKHYPDRPVIEVDKRDTVRAMPALRWLVGPEDLVFIHSGGNLGDRGLWSETGRRRVIAEFRDVPVVSLPQTIFFSDTEVGRRERRTTESVYGRHPRLTVIGRDPRSAELAERLFPTARTLAMPDFVLSLPPVTEGGLASEATLLCLRRDRESALSPDRRDALAKAVGPEVTRYDTTLSEPIPVGARAEVLKETLRLFRDHRAVVTDRYHGLIFGILTGRPTVALPTVDHKLTSAMHWFQDVRFVRLARSVEDVPALLREVEGVKDRSVPDWNTEYFDRLPGMIR
jgi:pyruvyl transferase EpsI